MRRLEFLRVRRHQRDNRSEALVSMAADSGVHISGTGLVTPLGSDLGVVWQRLASGDVAEAKPMVNPETGAAHQVYHVPPKLVDHLGRNPRLRRSSAISYFAVSAGLAALQQA